MAARRRLPTGAQDTIPMPLSFPTTEHLQESWGRPPWSAADAPVGLLAFCMMLISLFRLRDEGVPRRPGGLPHNLRRTSPSRKLSDIGMVSCAPIVRRCRLRSALLTHTNGVSRFRETPPVTAFLEDYYQRM